MDGEAPSGVRRADVGMNQDRQHAGKVTAPADLFVIGGGVNGCGIARDAAGRGLSVVLAEQDDLAAATSSASTKLFHGGLRYLEYFEFRLVREALIERERLLSAMPHISRPMRFVLPWRADMRFDAETPVSRVLGAVMPWMKGRRPAWLIRLGLFLYDHIGGRRLLPPTAALDLAKDAAGRPLQPEYGRAWEYSDCWIDDARLVVLNARDAAARGARILTRTRVTGARRQGDLWLVETEAADGTRSTHAARALVNAAGPWVETVLRGALGRDPLHGVRLVRGSHIVTRRLFDHDRAYFFQGRDGRIVFAIPYERDFTLIGTTDVEHEGPPGRPRCTPAEVEYLCAFVSDYFARAVTEADIVWTFSGVRPLYDDGASSATAATRDYVLSLEAKSGAPLLNIFGGKITTYRRLAENALRQLAPWFPEAHGAWTAGYPLPGGDFPVGGLEGLAATLRRDYLFLDMDWAMRLVCAYGTDAWRILGDAVIPGDLGRDFGATLSEREVAWMIAREFARTPEDVLWRRSKLGLRLGAEEVAALAGWMTSAGIDPGRRIRSDAGQAATTGDAR